MSSNGAPRAIHQWSGPRSMSTAAMYSWHARGDTTCVDEPLYAHHLRSCPSVYRPYRDELLRAQPAEGEAVVRDVLLAAQPTPLAFFKHIVKQAINIDMRWAAEPGARHVILIRHPLRMLVSFATTTGWAEMKPSLDELSLPQLAAMHAQLTSLCDQPPVVVDADDLSAKPEATLRALCGALGIDFSAAMLSWPAGPKPCDGMWAAHWYESVHKSTGWSGARTTKAYRTLAREHMPTLRAALPFYDYLQQFAIKPLELEPGPGAASSGGPTSVLDHGVPRSLIPDERNLDLLAWVGPPGKGGLVPRERARVSVFDSAVQGGDAVWEGLRIYRGKVFKFERHLRRLYDSAKAMAFANVHTPAEIREAVTQTLAVNGMRDDAHIRLTLSRGEKTTSSMNPNFNAYGCTLIVLAEWKPVVSPATYDNAAGIALITAANRRNPPSCVDSKIHHNNLINNILPKIQANAAGAADAIMLDLDGFVSETNATNLFLAKGGVLLTPHADHCLPGITRETVIALAARLAIPFVERRISLAEFHAADEVFTTGTMGELSPVTRIDGRTIGDGAPGAITRRLQTVFATLPDEDHPDHLLLPAFS
jgi:branched-chain amino acid aminotransferase group I